MNPDIKADWIDALRSGFYKQGKYRLRDSQDFYDPIGVLCERAVAAGVLGAAERYDGIEGVADSDGGYRYKDGNHTTATRLPKAVEKWSGLAFWSANRVITMNDNGRSFDLIADFIEENF